MKITFPFRDWGLRFRRLYQQYTSWENSKDPERPLVIGYVSPDYFTHSVSYFIEAPLIYHDYAKYKVIVYSAVVKVSFTIHACEILHIFLVLLIHLVNFLRFCVVFGHYSSYLHNIFSCAI